MSKYGISDINKMFAALARERAVGVLSGLDRAIEIIKKMKESHEFDDCSTGYGFECVVEKLLAEQDRYKAQK